MHCFGPDDGAVQPACSESLVSCQRSELRSPAAFFFWKAASIHSTLKSPSPRRGPEKARFGPEAAARPVTVGNSYAPASHGGTWWHTGTGFKKKFNGGLFNGVQASDLPVKLGGRDHLYHLPGSSCQWGLLGC